LITLDEKILKKITKRLEPARLPCNIPDCKDIKTLYEFAERYGICRLPSVLPDRVNIHMARQKSPSGNRIIKITAEHYIEIPDGQKKIPDDSGGRKKRGPYITKKTAGETDDVPGYLPVITNKKYRDAISFNCNSSAFLQVLSDSAAFTYKNSCTSLKGLPATYENIKEYCTNDGMKEVHIPLLMALFGILLLKFSASPDTPRLHETACIYYPELAKRLGKPSTGVKDINAVMGAMEKLKKVIGIVDGGKKSADILPALLSCEYRKDTNTIRFASPYIARVIKEIHKACIRTDQSGNPVLNKNGGMQRLPAYSYLVSISIEKERNRKAVEIVIIITALIEQAGKNIPHIRAKTIVGRSSLLKESLRDSYTQNKDAVLRRSFSKAWELLRTKTRLSDVYKDLELPDPENPRDIPTSATLDMVFRFPHKAKNHDI